MSTDAGNVSVEIVALNSQAEVAFADLEKVIQQVIEAMEKLAKTLEKLRQQGNGALDTVEKGMKDIENTTEKATTKVSKLDSLLNKVKTTLNKAVVSKSGGLFGGLEDLVRLQTITFSLARTVGKFYMLFNLAKMFGSMFGNMMKLGTDYTETMNLYAQAMQDHFQEGLKWVDKISNTYGLAEERLMHYQGTFKNMIGALGSISDEQAYKLSKTVTLMAIDYASLFNFEIEDAMEKFQSALSQQTKAIRTGSGFDITMKSLQIVLDKKGIDRSINDLSIVEKRLAIILALQEQIYQSGAWSDYAREINEPANQLRVLKNQLRETAMWIGRVAVYYLKPAITYFTALAIVIKNVVRALAFLVGYRDKDRERDPSPRQGDYGVGGVADNFDNVRDSVKKAGKEVDEFKRKLAGFDEITIIGNQKKEDLDLGGGGLAGVGGIGGGAIDPALLDAINDYEEKMQNINMWASEIAKRMLEWLGFTIEVDEETGEWKAKLESLDGTRLGTILNVLKVIAITLAGLAISVKIINGIIALNNWLVAIKKLLSPSSALAKGWSLIFGSASVGTVGMVVAIVVALVVAFAQLYKRSEDFRKTVNETFSNLWKLIMDVVDALKSFLEPILAGLKVLWEGLLDLLEPFFTYLLDSLNVFITQLRVATLVLTPVISVLGEIIGLVLALIGYVLQFVGGVLKLLYQRFKEWVVEPFKEFLTRVNRGKTIVQGLKDGVSNFVKTARADFESLKNKAKEVLDNIKNFFKDAWDNITSFFKPSNLITNIGSALGNLNPFNWGKPRQFATGGLPQAGELFIANEAGAELVGNIGGRTAVASNDMIVEAIHGAVYSAMRSAIGSNSNNSSGDDIKVYLGIKDITQGVVREINAETKRTGKNPLFST